ncbi:class I SAM-dependent methyltransferase, partial [Vibrio alginolyticus]|nr:class I SAM-dependent methyltransferase [Vibrio alginolyticus]MDW2227705.1 class I SAM-dependent methyltransferase [Vibrio sp. 1761]
FSRDTFQFLAERDKLELEFIGNDVILLRKTQ